MIYSQYIKCLKLSTFLIFTLKVQTLRILLINNNLRGAFLFDAAPMNVFF